jgi:hypothetical protein
MVSDASQSGCVVAYRDDRASDYAVAIVTGGSCGAGRDIARTLARRGFAVVLVYVRDQRAVEAAVEEILAANGTALAVRADVTDELDVERLLDETVAAFGGLDVVVHAGVRGSAIVNRLAARQLRHGGAIVDASSSEAITGVLADELRARDITVNGVAPGLEPPGAEHDIADLVAFLDRWRPSHPAARPGGWTGDPPGAMDQSSRDAPPDANRPTEVKMSSADVGSGTSTETTELSTIDMALEVVQIPVSDTDRAKDFYLSLGWRFDIDLVVGDLRTVQVTPPHSPASIQFGKGRTNAEPGSAQGMILVVSDIDAARADLMNRGVDVSVVEEQRPPGFDGPPGERSYFARASFSDPDGNTWVLQEITTRLPGRTWGD